MKVNLLTLIALLVLVSCNDKSEKRERAVDLEGTWQLVSGTLIEKGDTTFTDYTKAHPMIKIINKTHFAFLNHDLTKGKDSTALFVAGVGRYELNGDQYTEHLEYCSDRMWEGNDFKFTVQVLNDTLIQQGTEKIEGTGIDRINVEKYVSIKK